MNTKISSQASQTTTEHALPASIEQLVRALKSEATVTPELAAELMADAQVNPRDLEPWTDFKHPVRDGYGRRCLYADDNFELMVMSWRKGDFSAIHDHGYAQWGAVQIFGAAEHAVFEIDEEGILRTRVRNRVHPGSINPVDHDLIHQMGNPDQAPFISLHLYGSYDHKGEITGDARLFDLFTNKIQMTNGGVFFCLESALVTREIEGPRGDFATQTRHDVEMLRHILRMLTRPQSDREALSTIAQALKSRLFSPAWRKEMNQVMESLMTEENSIQCHNRWNVFWQEVHAAANLKQELDALDDFPPKDC